MKRKPEKIETSPPDAEGKGQTTLKKTALPKKAKTPFQMVTGIVKKSRKGVTVADIRAKTGLEDQQIRNCIYKAKRQGEIEILSRGVYGPPPQPSRPARKAAIKSMQ